MITIVPSTHCGGLAIPIFYELAEADFENSSKITSELTPLTAFNVTSMKKSQTTKAVHKTDFKLRKTTTKAVYKN